MNTARRGMPARLSMEERISTSWHLGISASWRLLVVACGSCGSCSGGGGGCSVTCDALKVPAPRTLSVMYLVASHAQHSQSVSLCV